MAGDRGTEFAHDEFSSALGLNDCLRVSARLQPLDEAEVFRRPSLDAGGHNVCPRTMQGIARGPVRRVSRETRRGNITEGNVPLRTLVALSRQSHGKVSTPIGLSSVYGTLVQLSPWACFR